MKKIFLLSLALSFLTVAFAQNTDYIKGKTVGINFFMTDFEAASSIRSHGIVETLRSKQFLSRNNINPGFGLTYQQGLSKHMDFAAALGLSTLKYPNENIPNKSTEELLLELTGGINFKLLSDHYLLTPYASLGAGVSSYGKSFGAFIPAGLGLQFNLSNTSFIHINSQYRIPVTEKVSYHFYHSIGFSETISKRAQPVARAVEIPVVLDRDGDGVVDSLDRCPDEPGLAALQGCPDRDGDGIPDIDDKCPDVKGVAKYQGCPVPDRDGDGINDEEDKCPDVPGVARYQGCPVPDSDGDGVNDEEDKCPHEAGPASNFGCPVIDVEVIERVNKAAENILFQTNSHKLLPKSFTELKEVVKILTDNPSYNITIDGHTDNTGSAEFNKGLSERRANSVKEYLIEHGIAESRITSAGHGLEQPIADNKTAAGRAKNRRVEMKIKNY